MASYQFWTEQARRWSACVDYASPISAWAPEMHDALQQFGGDRLMVMREIRLRRVEQLTYTTHAPDDWSPEMHDLLQQCGGDRDKAGVVLVERRRQRRAEFEAEVAAKQQPQ